MFRLQVDAYVRACMISKILAPKKFLDALLTILLCIPILPITKMNESTMIPKPYKWEKSDVLPDEAISIWEKVMLEHDGKQAR